MLTAVEIRNKLLQIVIDSNASDLYLSANMFPIVRIVGELVQIDEEVEVLSPEVTHEIILSMLRQDQIEEYEKDGDLDAAFEYMGERFRINCFRQRGFYAATMRYLPSKNYTLDTLGLPQVYKDICNRGSGIVLVAGPTGSGKTTTLSAMINQINRTQNKHIITIEDPIEIIYKNDKCVIEQREVGRDTQSFARALKSALRQDPDVVLLGEMRDLESIRNAITLAETGHLVFSTIHARGATQTINKIIDAFPAEQQNQIRIQLADSILAIFGQRLVRTIGNKGRTIAAEIMVANSAIRNLIREQKIHQVPSIIQMSSAEGMQLLESDLVRLVQEQRISLEEALANCNDINAIKRDLGIIS